MKYFMPSEYLRALRRRVISSAFVSALVGVCISTANAEPTRQLYISDPDEVRMGDPVSTSIDAQGQVTVGPTIEPEGKPTGRPMTALAADGRTFFVGTAGGGLSQIAGKKRTSMLEAKDKVVTAVLSNDGDPLVATAPDAEVLRWTGKAFKSVVKLKSKYVWAMAEGKRRTLLVTGQPGQVVAVDAKKRTEVWFDPDESHLRAIVRHPQRGWIIGGGQKGIVYQLTGNRQARALYDSKFEEVTAFAIDPRQGDLYAAFVSAETSGTPLAERWIGPTAGESTEKKDESPFKGSEVVRIRRSGQVETLWSSSTEGAMALVFSKGRLYFATGTAPEGRARIYAIDVADRDRLSLWARLAPPLAPVMIPGAKDTLVVGTAPAGQLYRIGAGRQSKATYLSVEQDLLRTAQIGRVWFDADIPKGTRVAIALRSGNTKKPDDTWSKWSAEVTRPEGGDVKVPDARYVQLRAQLTRSKDGKSPRLKSMHASLVRHNVAPTINEVFILRRGIKLTSLPTETSKEKTVTLSNRTLGEMRKPEKREKRFRVRQTIEPGMMTVAWRVKDDDGDDLLYRVQMRRLDPKPSPWREVARDRPDRYWSFDSRAYPDGRYQFRVAVTDRPSNPPGAALGDQHESEPILIDNSAPTLSAASAKKSGKGLLVRARVQDTQSRIASAEVSVNGGPWLMLPARDGLIDAQQEALQVELGADTFKPANPTTVRIRVEDEAGNVASTSAQTTTK